VKEDIENTAGKTEEASLWDKRKELSRLYHKVAHFGRNING
jgi:hypothetical protein